ncbi:MAG: hypothetical protein AABX59_03515 [Nanoarchaeota archaeon]
MSGGRASSGKVKGVHYGDLGIQKPTTEAQRFIGSFSVELKRYRNFDLLAGWLNVKSPLRIWWFQCEVEARKNDVYPMLVVKANRWEPVVFIDFKLFYLFVLYNFDFIRIVDKNLDIVGIRQKELFKLGYTEFSKVLSSFRVKRDEKGVRDAV